MWTQNGLENLNSQLLIIYRPHLDLNFLDSVLDDNKLLTLPNGERSQSAPKCSHNV